MYLWILLLIYLPNWKVLGLQNLVLYGSAYLSSVVAGLKPSSQTHLLFEHCKSSGKHQNFSLSQYSPCSADVSSPFITRMHSLPFLDGLYPSKHKHVPRWHSLKGGPPHTVPILHFSPRGVSAKSMISLWYSELENFALDFIYVFPKMLLLNALKNNRWRLEKIYTVYCFMYRYDKFGFY
jgi:hypothetical protein